MCVSRCECVDVHVCECVYYVHDECMSMHVWAGCVCVHMCMNVCVRVCRVCAHVWCIHVYGKVCVYACVCMYLSHVCVSVTMCDHVCMCTDLLYCQFQKVQFIMAGTMLTCIMVAEKHSGVTEKVLCTPWTHHTHPPHAPSPWLYPLDLSIFQNVATTWALAPSNEPFWRGTQPGQTQTRILPM